MLADVHEQQNLHQKSEGGREGGREAVFRTRISGVQRQSSTMDLSNPGES